MAPEQPEKQQQQRVTLGSDDQELIHTVLLPWLAPALALCVGSIRGLAAHWFGWFGGDLPWEQSNALALRKREGTGQQHASPWGYLGSWGLYLPLLLLILLVRPWIDYQHLQPPAGRERKR